MRAFLRRVTGPGPPPPSPAELAAQAAARTRVERERASQAAVTAQRAAEAEAAREEADRQRRRNEAFCEQVKAAGVLFPGDRIWPAERNRWGSTRPEWVGRVLHNIFGL